MFADLENIPPYVFTLMGLWSVFWKGLALWSCSKRKKVYWFISILVLNTLGILPLIYLIFFDRVFLKDFFKNPLGRKK